MFSLEIMFEDNPPTIDLCGTVEECADLAIQQIDDGTRKDFSEIRKSAFCTRSVLNVDVWISGPLSLKPPGRHKSSKLYSLPSSRFS